jgi:hypothetical protein
VRQIEVNLPTLHSGQVRALSATQPSERQLSISLDFNENAGGKRRAVRCGRRWGKTALDQVWLGDGAIKGYPNAIFAPDYKRMSEVFEEMKTMLAPVTVKRGGANKTDGVIRLITGGRIDFWTLEDENAGRSRKYKRVVLDECGFAKANMLQVWERAIEPTLLDLNGDCIATSNTNGISPDNFLWQICNEPRHGFIEVHEPTWNNPHVPGRLFEHQMPTQMSLSDPDYKWLKEKLDAAHQERVDDYFRRLRARTHPLVFAQEYEAEFVDWSGAAFFTLDKWLGDDGQPIPDPRHVDTVFAVIDSAVKTGSANDGTAVIYFGRNKYAGTPLMILDWDLVQIEGASLYPWLESVFANLSAMARQYGAREGVRGVWVEDKASGSILLQQARKLRSDVYPIAGQWLTFGKDERALAVSSYHYQGTTKILRCAYDKVTLYKGAHRNHLIGQVSGFRIGDKDAAKRADDLLDAYVHGLELAFGDGKRTG